MIKDSLQFQQNGPVTCLGREFPNDQARREYFREELRKKLPELRQIEGFPLGEDDDIINLSDPPYYTACPNPWLNDFIAEWEKEKEQLEAEGKRKSDFEVKEPYASDVSEGKNNPVYTAHTYHTKVPHPAIMRYILYYTQPGDVILDGFAGTGMTGAAAASCANSNDDIARRINGEWEQMFGVRPMWGARHAVIGDLSPYATNIAYFYNTPFDINALKKEVDRIKTEMENECGWMYTTQEPVEKGVGKDKHFEMIEGRISFVVWSDIMVCPSCGQEYVFWNQAVDHNQKCMLDSYHCPHCHAEQSKKTASTATETYFDEALQQPMKRVKQVPVIIVGKAGKIKIQRAPTQYDLDVLKRIQDTKIDGFFPTDALPEGLKTRDPKVKHIYHIHQFYSRRNLIAMSKLYAKIEASPLSHILRFMFTGMIHRSASMQRVIINYYFNGGGGWNGAHLKGTLYVPNAPTETSVLEQIDDKFGGMKRASEMLANVRPNIQYVGSADNLTIKENSIDYIFTDPPFGANINYSELNSLPEPWLRVITNNSHEAVENMVQGKSAQTYRDTMTNCFSEYYRVLKPKRWMTVEFSNTSAAVWNSIQNSLQAAGFIIVNVSSLDKKQGSFNAVTTTTAVKQDLVISCYKPSKELQSINNESAEVLLWTFVDELIEKLAKPMIHKGKVRQVPERDPRILFDKVVSYYIRHGLQVPIDARMFQNGLEERYIEIDSMYFTPEQASEYRELRSKATEFAPMGIIVSDEANGIQWLKNLLKDTPKTYQEIQPEWMQAINVNGITKGDILPELMEILEDNFIKMDDGRWRLINMQDDVDKEAKRTKDLLKIFRQYVEDAHKPKVKIKLARREALRAGFKQCYIDKDFQTIVMVGDKIPQNLRDEDEVLLQFYEIALNKVG